MSVFVKVCGLRDAECVRAAAEAGADAVGFVFAESPRRVSPAEARDATKDLPEQVQRVAVMRHPSNDEWQAVVEGFGPDVLQTDAEDFATLEIAENVIRWPVLRQREGEAVEALPEVFVYEGADSGTGKTIDWGLARNIATQGKMILAGGLNPDNVGQALLDLGGSLPWGVDVATGVEVDGRKNADRIKAFIAAVAAAEDEETVEATEIEH